MRNRVIKEIVELAKNDERIMLLTADLGFNVVEVFADEYPKRYINVGIAEQNMTAVAAGLAMEGNMVFTYSIANFPTLRCMEQIRNLVCYHNANVKILAVGGGFAYGTLGMTHHGTEDIGMMRCLPNMKVYVPADEIEAVECLRDLYSYDGPAYLRMARGKENLIHNAQEKLDVTHLVKVAGEGYDICVLATGTILAEGIKLHEKLNDNNIANTIYSVPLIKPMDKKTITQLATKAKLMITMEEHNVIGGLGSAVAEALSELPIHAPLLRFGLQDTFTSQVGNQQYLRKYYRMDADSVMDEILMKLGD